jgi:hypothetical protein
VVAPHADDKRTKTRPPALDAYLRASHYDAQTMLSTLNLNNIPLSKLLPFSRLVYEDSDDLEIVRLNGLIMCHSPLLTKLHCFQGFEPKKFEITSENPFIVMIQSNIQK